MPKYYDEEGNEVEVMTQEEVQKIQEERDALFKEKEEWDAEKKRMEEGGKDKDENFKKFRSAYEQREKERDEAFAKLKEREDLERNSIKESLFKQFAGDDEDARKALEEEYSLINIEETTPDNIVKRVEKASKMAGLYKDEHKENPVFKGFWGGVAPNIKPTKPSEEENIVNTDKGKKALEAMGIPPEIKDK